MSGFAHDFAYGVCCTCGRTKEEIAQMSAGDRFICDNGKGLEVSLVDDADEPVVVKGVE